MSKKLKGLINGKDPVHGDVEVKCRTCGSVRMKQWSKRNVKFCSRECANADPSVKERIRSKRIQAIQEGNVGFGTKCEFRGIRCDSALEYAFLAWYTESHPIASIQRFKGSLSGEGITYIPDFIIDGKILVEVKYMPHYVGDALSKKWSTYVNTMEKKKKLLEASGMDYIWVTNKDIGQSFYKKCLRILRDKSGR